MSSELLSSESETVDEPITVKLEPSTEQMSSPRTSPPSSPPVARNDGSQDMPPATRKRSHEEMNVDAAEANDSSTTAVGDGDTQTKQSSSEIVAASAVKPSTAAHSMPPPLVPASSKMPPSQKPPRSGQGLANTQNAPSKSTSPTNNGEGKQRRSSSTEGSTDEDTHSSSSLTLSDPQDRIEDFDWDDLQQRYHEKIAQLDATEQSILTEFDGLCNYFAVWAQTGSTHEVERSFKRLKTHMTYVQHHEDELEQKRQHYIKVVDAFKSALDLLVN